MLKLRRGTVVATDPLKVEVDGERRPRLGGRAGWSGECEAGDEVVVNTAALDLGLGSGGFDVVHVNLTRGLAARGPAGDHVMKLNYSSLQHAVEPIEGPASARGGPTRLPVLVIPLHGHLAPAAWAASPGRGSHSASSRRPGGALPGTLSRDVGELRERGLLAGHVTAGRRTGASRGDQRQRGPRHRRRGLGWDAAIAGPGPGILGSETQFGHGGMAALDTPTRASRSACRRWSARGFEARTTALATAASATTRAVLELLLAPVGFRSPRPRSRAGRCSRRT